MTTTRKRYSKFDDYTEKELKERAAGFDKADGPWRTEFDRVVWTHKGVPCLVLRHPTMGHLCGYVGVPPGHPWHGDPFDDWSDDAPNKQPDCHGGVTYGGERPPRGEGPGQHWWVGFDCAHSGDLSPFNRGFFDKDVKGPLFVDDQASWPTDTYKTVTYVERWVERLAEQAVEVASPAPSPNPSNRKIQL